MRAGALRVRAAPGGVGGVATTWVQRHRVRRAALTSAPDDVTATSRPRDGTRPRPRRPTRAEIGGGLQRSAAVGRSGSEYTAPALRAPGREFGSSRARKRNVALSEGVGRWRRQRHVRASSTARSSCTTARRSSGASSRTGRHARNAACAALRHHGERGRAAVEKKPHCRRTGSGAS